MKKQVFIYDDKSDDGSEIQQPVIEEKPKKVSKPKPSSKANIEKARLAKLEQLKQKKVEDARRVLANYEKRDVRETADDDSSSEEEVITIKTSKPKRRTQPKEEIVKEDIGVVPSNPIPIPQPISQPNDELLQLRREMEELKKSQSRPKTGFLPTVPQSDSIQQRQLDLEATILAMKKNLFSL